MSPRILVLGICLAVCLPSLLAAEPAEREKAVALAADWLAVHQLEDRGWSFDHRLAPGCDGKCANHGDLGDARNAATSMAVLALLAASQGEKDAKHEKALKNGLAFLVSKLKERGIPAGKTYTFEEPGGSMYAHGLSSLALCEGYRTTGDMALREPCQRALGHIAYAQDPVGGGWRYSPRQAGDTSATGWQLAALVSARGAMFDVPELTFKKANEFIDSVQSDGGARYGYTGPGAGQATTAIGLLARRRLGWKQDNPSFVRGIEHLTAMGPSKTNQYYNYYATQAMRKADDASWKAWREKMDRVLLESQAKDGHAAGSWSIVGDHGATHGGRLYSTAMSTMILSVEQGKLAIFKK